MPLPDNTSVFPWKESACEKHGYFAALASERLRCTPGFIVYDERFLSILGENPSIELIAENSTDSFAHEAGVYVKGDIFITSNHLMRNGAKYVQISKVSKTTGTSNHYHIEQISASPAIHLANGGVNYRDGILFCEQGSLSTPGGLTYMSAEPPYRSTPLLTNYHGRWFNSVNDVVVHRDGSIWFTDPPYGFEQGIRPVPQLPAHTYRFDPGNGDIRAVEDSLLKPNGLCFSPDQGALYITDTAGVRGDTRCPGVYSPAGPASIYAFDVVERHGGFFLASKRLFAFADQGIPDGIKCDTMGNVYSGCGDGVHVWAAGGTLLGKIFVPGGCANFCFGKGGEMFLLNEKKMWRAQLGSGVKGDLMGL
ncbi:calcium-dependent phosphotriesterase [Lophiostoma macrostomum CBS 122681]|uniref:Calcium-dependent phosphotriesterase n=1 Tax=Lophiostoma macrostomum CBS 122681 TaxID=1314788 RepID=A0A6A6TF09_9PLEO|nr:calcium-dependent phosphotriesterase [Lophiostoma macrostomum CBS 122681]